MQMSPSCAGRPEFIVSEPSACQVTSALSIGAPSGGPSTFPCAVNVTCHIPTMAAALSDTYSREAGDFAPFHACLWNSAPFTSPHDAWAAAARVIAHTTVNRNFLKLVFI